jgi:CRP-like cAMP-binding protein
MGDVAVERSEMLRPAYHPNEPITDVFFPLTAVSSVVAVRDDERVRVEVATVGHEGMVGLPVYLGAATSPQVAYCQVPGDTVRVGAEQFLAALSGDGVLRLLLGRYTQAAMVQIAQNVVCNRSHDVRQRMARWLLTTQDRVGRDEFPLTQEFLGQMLGVHRPTVADTAHELQAQNVIRYGRGHLRVVDRTRLQRATCQCYHIVATEFEAMRDFQPAMSRVNGAAADESGTGRL